jgi:predicted Zn-dependent peptidase
MNPEVVKLNSGLRVVYEHHNSIASHAGFFIDCGTRDEKQDEFGMAHFIEHCLFKGTNNRKAFHVLSRIDNVGGELNAFTSKEDTVIHASFLAEHTQRSVELLSDITFNSTFPDREITKEKLIVIDEIYAYQDSPGEQIYDDFEDKVFTGHPLGHNILGTLSNIKRFNRASLTDFYSRNYTPSNIIFSYCGSQPLDKIIRLLEKYTPAGSDRNTKKSTSNLKYEPRHVVSKRDVNQAHLMIGNLAYDSHHENRRALVLLNNILGGPAMNSRLNLNISEKYGFAYHLESGFVSYADTGLFSVYLGTEPKYLDKSIKLIHRELDKLVNKKLGPIQLNQARQQLKGQLSLARESGLNTMLAMGKSLMNYDEVDTLEDVFEQIESITAEQLQDVAADIFNPDQMSSLIFEPNN